MKKILLISLIASQLIWNISDSLVRESWVTEEQSEQDFSKEKNSKEKEISFESFFRSEIKSLQVNFLHFLPDNLFSVDLHEANGLYSSVTYLKIPLYLLQSCIRI